MKDFFQILGVVALLMLSFFYTEEAITVVRNFDDLMTKIKEEKGNYEIEPIDAVIINDEIIPGLNGKAVNENKSYRNMKRVNEFNPNLLEYTQVKPNISLEKNFQKYIVSGNPKKKMVSLLFLVNGEVEIENILEILKQKRIKGNFFVDGNWLEENNDQVNQIAKEGHLIGNLGYDFQYVDTNFTWLNTTIKQLTKQQNNYCYKEIKNIDDLKICTVYKNYTINPNLVIDNDPLKQIKDKIAAGFLISFSINDQLLDELGVIINYIKAKGYEITTLDEHLSEMLEY